MQRAFVLAATLAGFLMAACGGDRGQSPSAVATPAPPAALAFFTVVSGETQAPVAGARVVVAGAELVSDGQGRVSLTAGLSPTAFVDVVAAGFLDRQTQVSRAGNTGQLTLWPRESATGLTEHFTNEVVYTTSWTGVEVVLGAEPLTRWASSLSQVSVVYLGLRHSSDASDVMRAFGRRTDRPSDRERLVMALMMQRPGGNRYPDNDRSARTSASTAVEIACRP